MERLNFDEMNQKFRSDFDEINSIYGVEAVITQRNYGSVEINGEVIPVYGIDEDILSRLYMPIRGELFEQAVPEADQLIPVLMGGSAFSQTNEGTVLQTIQPLSREERDVEVKAAIRYPGYSFNFSNSSTYIYSNYLIEDRSSVFVWEDSYILDALGLLEEPMLMPSAWVILEGGLSADERSAALTQLRDYGSYNELTDIYEHSREVHGRVLREILPIPLFLFFSAFTALFSIAALYVLRNHQNQALYYLCGCSKRRMMSIIVQGLLPIVIIPSILTSFFILNYDRLREIPILQVETILFNQESILTLVSFVLILVLSLTILPFVIHRRLSPLALYQKTRSRRNETFKSRSVERQ